MRLMAVTRDRQGVYNQDSANEDGWRTGKEVVMFSPTAHVHRLIVWAILALVVVPAMASGQANVYELAFGRDNQIFKVRSDGTGPVQLTSEGVNSEPAWAPDGARIAFVRQGPAVWMTDIFLMNADGSNVVRLTDDGRSSSPAWSPDGTRIAFSSWRNGQTLIYVMRLDGDWWNPAPLGFDRGVNAYPAWSPDGSRIAFVSDWRGFDLVSDLYVMNADGSDVTLLLSGPFFGPAIYYFQPAWSPDGGTIALARCGNTTCTGALVNADGSGLRSIADAGNFVRPSWSPDGTSIAFGCYGCPSAIHYVTRDGSASGVLIPDGHSPAWRPSALPAGWAQRDLGTVAVAGTASVAGQTWTLSGSGANPSETSDRYQYVYRALTGDGIIVARVAAQQHSNGWERASVMMRATLAPGSPHASMLVTSANGLWYGRRLSTDDVSAYTYGGDGTAPVWIGLMRTGQVIEAFRSADGVNWTWIGGDTFPMPETVYVGLAVTSLDDDTTAAATFDGVAVWSF
jgi:TolB protein